MKTLGEKNFEMMIEFALSCDEMLKVRGGDDGEGGGGDPEDSDPEKPPIVIKI